MSDMTAEQAGGMEAAIPERRLRLPRLRNANTARIVVGAAMAGASLAEVYVQVRGTGTHLPALGIFRHSGGHFGGGFLVGLPVLHYMRERASTLTTIAVLGGVTQAANAVLEFGKGAFIESYPIGMNFLHDPNTCYDALATAIGAGVLIGLSGDLLSPNQPD